MSLALVHARYRNPEKVYDNVEQELLQFKHPAEIMKWLVDKSTVWYTCNRPPCAAGALILTQDSELHVIMASGVQPPGGTETCKKDGCLMENGHCVRTIHAEQNAICFAASLGIVTKGAIMYSVLRPCYECSKHIIAAGIKRIYYAGVAYDEERTRKILENACVQVMHIDVELEYGNGD